MVTRGLRQQVQVKTVVLSAEEDPLAVITPLGDMVGKSGEYDARATGHAR